MAATSLTSASETGGLGIEVGDHLGVPPRRVLAFGPRAALPWRVGAGRVPRRGWLRSSVLSSVMPHSNRPADMATTLTTPTMPPVRVVSLDRVNTPAPTHIRPRTPPLRPLDIRQKLIWINADHPDHPGHPDHASNSGRSPWTGWHTPSKSGGCTLDTATRRWKPRS
jgi:hypothetical protein